MDTPVKTAVRNSPIFKIVVCGFLGLLLMIPASMVQDLVRDRSSLKSAATAEIASKWGASTTLAGPILSIPYASKEVRYLTPNGIMAQTGPKTGFVHVLPSELFYETSMDPSIRSRGIYDVTVYRSANVIRGKFDLEWLSALFEKLGTPDYSKALVTIGFSDSKGVEAVSEITFGSASSPFVPGSEIRGVLSNGTSAKIDLSSMSGTVSFSSEIVLRGSEWMKFVPLGKTTSVKMSSAWPNPSFDGAFLPSSRTVNESGFQAEWKILDYNRNFPQHWVDNAYSLGYVPTGVSYEGGGNWDGYGMMAERSMKYASTTQDSEASGLNIGNSAFGVSLKPGVDSYSKTSRTVNYAILIVGLTFVAFFLMEILHKLRIHPIQYLLVGFALVVFYTLTLSLSEHFSFDLAYLASATLTTALITAYVAVAFKSKALTATIAAILGILYAFIYVILSSEDYALLLWSFGIFLVLALLMYATRNVDWYAIGEKRTENGD